MSSARSYPDAPSKLPDPRPRLVRGGPVCDTVSVKLRTVTPVLGGATRTRALDDFDPVRAPSIRGQLRFWWRALKGHEPVFGSAEVLFATEATLWGHAADDDGRGGRSQVQLRISDVTPAMPVGKNEHNPSSRESYALFPARSESRRNLPAAPRWNPGLTFTLHVTAPRDTMEEVTAALRAWIMFGGYGARTRRGVGSLTVVDAPDEWLPRSDPDGLRAEFERLLGRDPFAAGASQQRDFPLLSGAALFVGDRERNAERAWTSALDWLGDFRQARSVARDPGTTTPGLSRWPEADKIRHLYMTQSGRRTTAHTPRHNDDPVWPRAGFGLPIVGRFKDRGDPDQFAITWFATDDNGRPVAQDRMASPLIVKALPVQGGFLPCALWLNRRYPPGDVGIDGLGGPTAPFGRLVAPGDTPLFAPLAGKATLRDAFLDWIKTKGAKEIAR